MRILDTRKNQPKPPPPVYHIHLELTESEFEYLEDLIQSDFHSGSRTLDVLTETVVEAGRVARNDARPPARQGEHGRNCPPDCEQ